MEHLTFSNPALTIALGLAAGIIAQSVAYHLRIPGIVLLLITGVLLGPDVSGVIQPETLDGALADIIRVCCGRDFIRSRFEPENSAPEARESRYSTVSHYRRGGNRCRWYADGTMVFRLGLANLYFIRHFGHGNRAHGHKSASKTVQSQTQRKCRFRG